MTPPKIERVRANKPKVKTGCKTCKIRRVKCDEAKPQCLRCIKFGRECDGYDEPNSLSVITVPKPSKVEAKTFTFVPIVPYEPICPQLKTAPYINSQEHQYFRYFQEHTAPTLSGGFDSVVWSRIVLQMGTSEPAIHKLIISIGALSCAAMLPHQDSDVIANHRQYASREYGKALPGIFALAKSGDSRSVLVASLLIFCFEILHDNILGAVQYLRSARDLILGTTETLIYRHFKPLPTTPKDIEADLITTFTRLDGSIANRLEPADPNRASVLRVVRDFHAEPYDLPPRFVDPETARRHLEHIQYRSRPSAPRAEIIQRNASSVAPQNSECKFGIEEMKLLESQMRAWEQAFEPLFKFSRTTAGTKDYVAAMTIKIQVLSTICLMEGLMGIVPGTAPLISSADRILDACRDMVRYGWELVGDERCSKGFMFEHGILPNLMIVVVWNPGPTLTREVINILRAAAPRREATWDAVKTADICEKILMMRQMQQPQGSNMQSPIQGVQSEKI